MENEISKVGDSESFVSEFASKSSETLDVPQIEENSSFLPSSLETISESRKHYRNGNKI